MSSRVGVKPCRKCGKHFLVLKGEELPFHECKKKTRTKGRRRPIGRVLSGLNGKAGWLGVTVVEIVLAIVTGKSKIVQIVSFDDGGISVRRKGKRRIVYLTENEVERVRKASKVLKILQMVD